MSKKLLARIIVGYSEPRKFMQLPWYVALEFKGEVIYWWYGRKAARNKAAKRLRDDLRKVEIIEEEKK